MAGRAITPPGAWRRAAWAARLRPGRWVAQRRFETAAVESPIGPVFPCVGVYVVDGLAAGAYGRVTGKATIDFEAWDAEVLVQEVAG